MNKISQIAIIGAGVMGRGIAEANLLHGISVILTDSHAANLQNAVAELADCRPNASVRAATAYDEISSAQLVIEAVTEKLSVKQQVLATAERTLAPRAILATNTSSIPISRIAEGLNRPERFCGLHFCHPVSRRPLVEIIRGSQTSEQTIAEATAYSLAIGKSPIVVRDSPGFVVNRLLSPYLNESLELILEGAEPAKVEACARAFGMPLGPLRQFDEYGIDIAVRTGALLRSAFPDRALASELPVVLFGMGRHGRKTGAGFYTYTSEPPGGDHDQFAVGSLDHEVRQIIDERRSDARNFSPDEMTMRLFLPMLLEAARILEERIVADAATIDEALANGLGFLPLEGGLLRWADTVGLKRIVSTAKPLESLGKRYEAPGLLHDLAKQSISLYEAFPASRSIARAA